MNFCKNFRVKGSRKNLLFGGLAQDYNNLLKRKSNRSQQIKNIK
jgi:hypothetical protein